jgi:DNA-3-methyladenine glycosylase
VKGVRAAISSALHRAFFCVPAEVLAPRLLGCVLVRKLDDGARLAGEIVEVEAYLGVRDRACHTFGGRRTPRTEAMYGRAGTAYVYFTYGMHHCVNVVCGVDGDGNGGGVGEAVLIRALRPLAGLETMALLRSARRKPSGVVAERSLCSGPGKVCEALAIGRGLNGHDLLGGDPMGLETGREVLPPELGRSARIGVESAGAWARRRLRWFIRGSEHVSV